MLVQWIAIVNSFMRMCARVQLSIIASLVVGCLINSVFGRMNLEPFSG